MTAKGRDQQLADDVNYLKVTMDEVIKPALDDIKASQRNLAVVSTKEFEKKVAEIETRLNILESYINDNKPGISLASKLSATWVQVLVTLLAGGGVAVLVIQTVGAIK